MDLEVRTFFGSSFPEGKESQEVLGSLSLFKEEYFTSEVIPLKLLPASYSTYLGRFAARVLDPDNRHSILLGYPHVGKTFFLEQFVGNISHYLQASPQKTLHFITLTEVEMLELGTRGALKHHVEALKKELAARDEDLCFLLESHEVAAYLAQVMPKVRIILELNVDTFVGLMQGAARSASRQWTSWQVVDLNALACPREELVNLLWVSMAARMNKSFPRGVTKRQVRSFVNAAIRLMPRLVDEENEAIVILPPGIWASTLRYLYGLLNHTTVGATPLTVAEATSLTFQECIEYFGNLAEKEDDEGLPERLHHILQEAGARVVSVGAKPGKGQEDVKDLVFQPLGTLASRLQESILGQEEAVATVANALKVPAAGLHDERKPLRSFLFLGPTGVGKTQLALDLARELTTEPLHVVRIDMSEYQRSHEVAKLFGSPPGYVGHEEGGRLTAAVSEHPHSLVLLDEVEKAHPKVWDAFLQVLDSGRMTDARGQEVDFTKTVLIMTSNIGVAEAKSGNLGFNGGSEAARYQERQVNAKAVMLKEMEKVFRPEFINRIDSVVVFKNLTKANAASIARRELDLVGNRLKARGVAVAPFPEEVVEHILVTSDIEKYGAREIQRTIFQEVASKIADFIVGQEDVTQMALQLQGDEVTITRGKKN